MIWPKEVTELKEGSTVSIIFNVFLEDTTDALQNSFSKV